MPAPDHFSFTKLVVGDIEKSARFYKTVCGLTELARVDAEIAGRAIREIMFDATAAGGGRLVVLAYPDTPRPASSEVILGFVTTDLSAFVTRAREAGGSVLQDIEVQPQHGVRVAFVKDPEGHLIEVVELLQQARG